ncbi:hypothetical protein [Actinospongicola halichondriae]|uniref:hypothetical protein n=1 Tax=Actinospongicola halichondriae TaxID=3236844 RepID=UPI003D4AB8FA
MGRAELAAALVEQVESPALARERRLPVLPALESLIPGGGLRRGSTLATDGPAATSLALAAASAASQDGAWVAAVGFPSLGLSAAAELGIALERFVLVASPDTEIGPDNEETAWAAAVAALVDAFEIVLVRATHRVKARDGRRLAARARERGAVLVQVGSSGWAEGADVTLEVTSACWEGLADGHGHLRARRVTVVGGGRREASRPRRSELWLPSGVGLVESVVADPVPIHVPA